MKRALKYFFVLILIIALIPIGLYLRFLFFGGDFRISLSGGDTLVRIYAGAVLLSDYDGNTVISPNIDEYNVIERLIVGHVSCHNLPPKSYEADKCKFGYFVVDRWNPDKIQQGLDEKQWLNSLLKYGIIKRPSLHKPSRYDEFLGYNKPSGP